MVKTGLHSADAGKSEYDEPVHVGFGQEMGRSGSGNTELAGAARDLVVIASGILVD